MVPTFADEMRRQRSAHVVSLSLKARSAIMMAGHGGDAVTWLSDSLDGWTTSTAFATAPVPQVKEFVTANPIEADYGKTWNLLLPAVSYADPDAGVGETPPPGWTRSFPHVLRGNQGDSLPTDAYYTQWERSPFADAYLGRMAAALAESMQLGKHDTTDMLAVSFSSPDLVGHGFGPRSHEIREMYENLDRTLGTLFDHLDRLVGPDQYVVALSADHGVTEIPEQLRAEGRDGGRIDAQAIAQAVEQAAINAAGPGPLRPPLRRQRHLSRRRQVSEAREAAGGSRRGHQGCGRPAWRQPRVSGRRARLRDIVARSPAASGRARLRAGPRAATS